MKAVHFGAGNIGRGFVGLLLHDAGYEVVFADVNAELIDALAASESYTVHEVGDGGGDRTVTGFRAMNSATSENELIAEIQTADVVTTAVGPNILRFVAPVIARGLALRDPGLAPLAVMACENAINATDLLQDRGAGRASAPDEWEALAARAVFANTAVDRIVPGQDASAGIDVTVETFYEWVIESGPFGDAPPVIPGATFVDALGAVHRAQALHGQHRPRHRRLLRFRRGHRQDLRRPRRPGGGGCRPARPRGDQRAARRQARHRRGRAAGLPGEDPRPVRQPAPA